MRHVWLLFATCANALGFWHVTPPRHVTVSVKLGRVIEDVSRPGLAFKLPWTSSYDMLVEEQKDSVLEVQCGTSDGITLVFPTIEIHNLLPAEYAREMFLRYGPDYDEMTIFNNVKFFVGQICAGLTAEEVYLKKYNELDEKLNHLLAEYQLNKKTGIQVTKVKFYKPYATGGSTVLKEFQKRAEAEAEREALLAQSKRIEQANENALKTKDGENQLEAAKNRAKIERELDDMRGEQQKLEIEMTMTKLKAESQVSIKTLSAESEAQRMRVIGDAKAYSLFKEAEANKLLLTPEYLQLKQTESVLHASKMIIGNDIPKLMFAGTPFAVEGQATPAQGQERASKTTSSSRQARSSSDSRTCREDEGEGCSG